MSYKDKKSFIKKICLPDYLVVFCIFLDKHCECLKTLAYFYEIIKHKWTMLKMIYLFIQFVVQLEASIKIHSEAQSPGLNYSLIQ